MFHTTGKDALLSDQMNNIAKTWSTYTNPFYHVSLQYPCLWAKVDSLHYAGIDGYFRISALKSDMTLDEICKAEAYHKLQPYGSAPDIVEDTAAGHEVCLIIPSKDQPTDMKSQTALIVKFPKVQEIQGETYSHLILWTDKEHLNDIKNSLAIEG